MALFEMRGESKTKVLQVKDLKKMDTWPHYYERYTSLCPQKFLIYSLLNVVRYFFYPHQMLLLCL